MTICIKKVKKYIKSNKLFFKVVVWFWPDLVPRLCSNEGDPFQCLSTCHHTDNVLLAPVYVLYIQVWNMCVLLQNCSKLPLTYGWTLQVQLHIPFFRSVLGFKQFFGTGRLWFLFESDPKREKKALVL